MTIRRLQTAYTTPFDNTSNGFLSDNVQAAIEEAKSTATQFMWVFRGVHSKLVNTVFENDGVVRIKAVNFISIASPHQKFVDEVVSIEANNVTRITI
jgi:hypothetical protein